MTTYEYNEGKKAQEDFEEGMKVLFQVPKDAARERKKPAKKRVKKTSESDLPTILAAKGLKLRKRPVAGFLKKLTANAE